MQAQQNLTGEKRPVQLFVRQEMQRVLQSLDDLPTLPAVATQVLSKTLDEDASAEQIARIIETDQSLSIRILKLVNSAANGVATQVSSIRQAIVLLGMTAVRCAMLSVSVRDCFKDRSRPDDKRYKALWKHSLATAVAAELVAEKTYPQLRDEAFLAGLLHDVGKLVINLYFPDAFTKISAQRGFNGNSGIAAERNVLNVDHTLVGKWVAQKWRMPAPLMEAIWLHHQPYSALSALQTNRELLAVVMLADRLAHEVVIDYKEVRAPFQSHREIAEWLSLSEEDIASIKARVGKKYSLRAETFDLETNEAEFYYDALQRANSWLGSTALDMDRQTTTLNKANRILYATNEIGAKLAHLNDKYEIFHSISSIVTAKLGIKDGIIYLLDRENYFLEGICWNEDAAKRNVHCFLDVDHQPIFEEGNKDIPDQVKDILAGYTKREPAIFERHENSRQVHYAKPFIIIPLVAEDQFLGELCLAWRNNGDRKLSPHEFLGYSQIGALSATALNRVRLWEKLDEKTEELSTALWKNQQINLQLMQTERLAAVGQLAAGAAHEINNPLAIIYARAQLLQYRENDDKKRKELEQITEQIERISSILTNLMGFARPAPPKLEEVSINELLEKALSLVEVGCNKYGIKLQRKLQESIPHVKGDANQLEQVFLNLFINAQHAMEKDGGALTVSSSLAPDGREIVIEIEDSGLGIAPEDLPKIFDPFFTTKEDGKGTGLGLSTSYGIINNHYGVIDVRSELGKGATVLVRLPVDIESLRPAQSQAKNGMDIGSGPLSGKVLVVDDEKHIRAILKEALEAEGLEVDTAVNGEQGLEMIKTGKYRLLLLDIRMPLRSGLSLLSEIRDSVRQTTVFVITGMATPEQEEEAKALGATKCIRKPFHLKSLVKDIFDAIGPLSAPKNSPTSTV